MKINRSFKDNTYIFKLTECDDLLKNFPEWKKYQAIHMPYIFNSTYDIKKVKNRIEIQIHVTKKYYMRATYNELKKLVEFSGPLICNLDSDLRIANLNEHTPFTAGMIHDINDNLSNLASDGFGYNRQCIETYEIISKGIKDKKKLDRIIRKYNTLYYSASIKQNLGYYLLLNHFDYVIDKLAYHSDVATMVEQFLIENPKSLKDPKKVVYALDYFRRLTNIHFLTEFLYNIKNNTNIYDEVCKILLDKLAVYPAGDESENIGYNMELYSFKTNLKIFITILKSSKDSMKLLKYNDIIDPNIRFVYDCFNFLYFNIDNGHITIKTFERMRGDYVNDVVSVVNEVGHKILFSKGNSDFIDDTIPIVPNDFKYKSDLLWLISLNSETTKSISDKSLIDKILLYVRNKYNEDKNSELVLKKLSELYFDLHEYLGDKEVYDTETRNWVKYQINKNDKIIVIDLSKYDQKFIHSLNYFMHTKQLYTSYSNEVKLYIENNFLYMIGNIDSYYKLSIYNAKLFFDQRTLYNNYNKISSISYINFGYADNISVMKKHHHVEYDKSKNICTYKNNELFADFIKWVKKLPDLIPDLCEYVNENLSYVSLFRQYKKHEKYALSKKDLSYDTIAFAKHEHVMLHHEYKKYIRKHPEIKNVADLYAQTYFGKIENIEIPYHIFDKYKKFLLDGSYNNKLNVIRAFPLIIKENKLFELLLNNSEKEMLDKYRACIYYIINVKKDKSLNPFALKYKKMLDKQRKKNFMECIRND